MVDAAWLILLIAFYYLPWWFWWCYPPPSYVSARLFFPWMDEWCQVIAGMLIYPRGHLGVDRKYGIGLGRPGLWFCEDQDCDSLILRDVDVVWSLTNMGNMACWLGFFSHGRAATIMRQSRYQPIYVVDLAKVVDRK